MTNQTVIVLGTLVFLIQSVALGLKYTNQDALSHKLLLIGAGLMALATLILALKYKHYLKPIRIKKAVSKRRKNR